MRLATVQCDFCGKVARDIGDKEHDEQFVRLALGDRWDDDKKFKEIAIDAEVCKDCANKAHAALTALKMTERGASVA